MAPLLMMGTMMAMYDGWRQTEDGIRNMEGDSDDDDDAGDADAGWSVMNYR